jgi:ribosomal protein S18 acetylase RimI-like enzyme
MVCEYSINQSNLFQIKSHLNQCSEMFIPKLSTYVDIDNYSEKLLQKATRVEAFEGTTLAGLIAFYISEVENICFITNVSVLPEFTGKGIAKKLFYQTKNSISMLNVSAIILHVNINNLPAINFYEKLGFEHNLIIDNKIKMILNLK